MDQAEHMLVMRAFPEHLPAAGTAMKFIEIAFGQGFQPVQDFSFRHTLEQPVAARAALEGTHQAGQAIPAVELHQLIPGLEAAQARPPADHLAH